jgi:hypothetical protein
MDNSNGQKLPLAFTCLITLLKNQLKNVGVRLLFLRFFFILLHLLTVNFFPKFRYSLG